MTARERRRVRTAVLVSLGTLCEAAAIVGSLGGVAWLQIGLGG